MPDDAPDFVQRVTARIIAGEGDLLPVSAFPVDGTFPTGTAQYEKRTLATEIPIWDPDLCIDCNKCAMVCPHTAIRAKVAEPGAFELLPSELPHKAFKARELPGLELVIQVAPDDCTGCGICVDVCPARSKSESRRKAINLEPIEDHLEVERERFDSFLLLPEAPRADVPHGTVKGSQLLQPLFEFSGACSGCGETPYLKLLSQLFGDRAVIANATGCSSIYGGNLPTTPWTVNADGRGPAWSNSLFEDNAEFGLGIRLALDQARTLGLGLLTELAPALGADRLLAEIAGGVHDRDDAGIAAQRARVADLKARLAGLSVDPAQQARVRLLSDVVDDLVHRSVWIVGGDGWAYDIGFSGLDHAMASGRDINILVLDTEVYSNTGGQASKSTPRGAVAKFAMGGKHTPKKDLGAIAMAYGSVYVAQVALGGNDVQTLRAMQEAEEHRGPSLVIAYSTCIAHGIEMSTSMSHQKEAVASGYWPLYRFRPGAGRARAPVPAGLQGADHPVPRVRQVRGAVLDAGALAAAGRRGAGARRPGGHRRALALLRPAGRARAHRDGGRGGAAVSLDLATTYLGLPLRSPLVASAGPATRTLDGLRRLEQAGVGAVVLPSLVRGAAGGRGPPRRRPAVRPGLRRGRRVLPRAGRVRRGLRRAPGARHRGQGHPVGARSSPA